MTAGSLKAENERLREENERLRSALDMHERAGSFAKIEAALAVLNERLRCGEIEADVYVDVSKALRGDDVALFLEREGPAR